MRLLLNLDQFRAVHAQELDVTPVLASVYAVTSEDHFLSIIHSLGHGVGYEAGVCQETLDNFNDYIVQLQFPDTYPVLASVVHVPNNDSFTISFIVGAAVVYPLTDLEIEYQEREMRHADALISRGEAMKRKGWCIGPNGRYWGHESLGIEMAEMLNKTITDRWAPKEGG